MPMISTDDNQILHVRELGRGPKVVLVHGFGMDSRHWLPVIAPLAHRYHFIMPDLRGFGGSQHLRCAERCVVNTHARDLARVIEHYADEPIRLGGISLGAFVALQYLHTFGTDRVADYLHIDQGPRIHNSEDWPWGLYGHEGPERLARWHPLLAAMQRLPEDIPFEHIPLHIREQLHAELAAFVASTMSQRWLKWGVEKLMRQPLAAQQLFPTRNWRVHLQHIDAYLNLDYDFRPVLPKLDIPVTLMIGRRSSLYPWQGQAEMRRYLPDPRLVIMEKSGHLPLLDEPLRFIREMDKAFRPA